MFFLWRTLLFVIARSGDAGRRGLASTKLLLHRLQDISQSDRPTITDTYFQSILAWTMNHYFSKVATPDTGCTVCMYKMSMLWSLNVECLEKSVLCVIANRYTMYTIYYVLSFERGNFGVLALHLLQQPALFLLRRLAGLLTQLIQRGLEIANATVHLGGLLFQRGKDEFLQRISVEKKTKFLMSRQRSLL